MKTYKDREDFLKNNSEVFFHCALEKENVGLDCWHGRLQVTDLNNAMKRGKVCDAFSFWKKEGSHIDFTGTDAINDILYQHTIKELFEILRSGVSELNGYKVENYKQKGIDTETPFGNKKVEFVWNGIKIGDKIYRASYSKFNLNSTGEDNITIYGKNYKDLPKIDGLTIENNSDSMTDYCENDRIRVKRDNPHWDAVLKAYMKQQEHDSKIAKRKYKAVA